MIGHDKKLNKRSRKVRVQEEEYHGRVAMNTRKGRTMEQPVSRQATQVPSAFSASLPPSSPSHTTTPTPSPCQGQNSLKRRQTNSVSHPHPPVRKQTRQPKPLRRDRVSEHLSGPHPSGCGVSLYAPERISAYSRHSEMKV